MIRTKKGLDLPISGAPEQVIEAARPIRTVAVLGDDYPGMRPTMSVREGDRVRKGQALFSDKKTAGVNYTAPAAGVINAINRGAKRALTSVVVEVDGDDAETFAAPGADASREQIVEVLAASGLWTALRTRPFGKVPAVDSVPHSMFVTAIDTNPVAADPAVVIAERQEDFALGLDSVAKLTQGATFLCTADGVDIPRGSAAGIRHETFAGPHPAGLAGTHIHFLDPVGPNKTVWYLGYQDVIAIGSLLRTGELANERVLALAGPGVTNPRLLRTVLGASTDELTAGELDGAENRVVSGSVFTGHTGYGPKAFLGRYHNQVSVIPEGGRREFLGYLSPGFNAHSVFPIYLSRWLGRRNLKFTTTSNGSPRAMVPIGTYEDVMPMDILATQLLRSILTQDLDLAINLGCLELDEEDLALCTYTCPGKYVFGPVLRDVLDMIEKEG
jgi:Na+-transporting NADH:ubiquinone oxidoreductase subunit A